jgi:hypothetical protein
MELRRVLTQVSSVVLDGGWGRGPTSRNYGQPLPFKKGPSAFRKCTKSSNRITPSPISVDGGTACANTGSEPDDGGFVKLIVADMTFLQP